MLRYIHGSTFYLFFVLPKMEAIASIDTMRIKLWLFRLISRYSIAAVTVINRVNICDHRMVMGSITLNTRAERRKLLNKNTRTRVDTQMIGTKKNTFKIELKKQVHSTRRT